MASNAPDPASEPESTSENAAEAPAGAEGAPQAPESAAESPSEPEATAEPEQQPDEAEQPEPDPLPTHIPMIHPEGGSSDAYPADKEGIIQVAIEDVEKLLAHGFRPHVPASK